MQDTAWMRKLRLRTIASWIAFALSIVAVPAAQADYVTQSVTLDQSNVLPDGVSYGSVLIEANSGVSAVSGLDGGAVRLTFTANIMPDYVALNPSFGIDRVAFNTDLALKAEQLSGPTGWKTQANSTVSGFGKFTWEVQGNASGGDRLNPVSVLITGLGADATIGHFLFGSTGDGSNPPSEGSVFFALHAAGFELESEGATSQFIGGSGEDPNATPEPASFVLCGLGIGMLGLVHAARKRRRAEPRAAGGSK